MKLDVNALRYMSREDFRVLTAIEMGQKNHEIVPVELIDAIAGLKHGGTFRHLSSLGKAKLVHHDASRYNGFRLTNMGYDFLAIKTLLSRGMITSVGRQIGVGKESDVFEVMNEEGEIMALKLHRLGRTSFRAVKNKRDYLRNRNSFSWLYLSRLSALKEFAFMKALGQAGLPVPVAIDHNRHAVLMSMIAATPLVQIRELYHPGVVYAKLMELMARLAELGLVHCDFNEFNVLVDDDDVVTLIDFPQMISVTHFNAKELFERDVDCVIRFFKKKLGYIPEHDESLPYMRPDFEAIVEDNAGIKGLDAELAASGFKSHHQDTLERFELEGKSDSEGDSDSSDDSDSDSGRGPSDPGPAPDTAAAHTLPASDQQAGGGSLADPDTMRSAPAATPETDAPDSTPVAGPSPTEAAVAATEVTNLLAAAQLKDRPRRSIEGGAGSADSGDDDAVSLWSEAPSTALADAPHVQRRVTAQRQNAVRRSAMANATRNAQKVKSKKSRDSLNASMQF